ncbi:MAG: LuxR C-terminal-related transcriptional regulator [Solirubrobacteraceae bacterium]
MTGLPIAGGRGALFWPITCGQRGFLPGSAPMSYGGPFIGRERELMALERLVSTERLVTLVGPGGCGKTRLALEFGKRAEAIAGQGDRVVVELASVRAAERVSDALVRALGVRERSGRTQAQALLDSLADRRALLVLDNCEHVSAEVGRLTDELLAATRWVRFLVTSREPLRISGEVLFAVAPFGLPEVGGGVSSVVRSEAGRFFVDRAAAADPGFVLAPATARAVVRICHALDGLPLALDLAAARVGVLAIDEIADGLSRRGRLAGGSGAGAVSRHRSIRASLDWSYQLLEERERVLLRRLATFGGGWSAEAAHAVGLPEAAAPEVFDLLERLQAKGLIVAAAGDGRPRWTLLQTVSEYAAEQLALDEDRAATRDRHLAWFRALASEGDRLLLDPDARDLVDSETPNLRVALDWAIEHDADSAMAIAASLARHWILAERFAEGSAACAAALSVADDRCDPGARAVVHCAIGVIDTLSGDYEQALTNTYAGLGLLGEVGSSETRARCLQLSAMVLILTGVDLSGGLRNAGLAVEMARSVGDLPGLAWALVNVAMAEGICDRFDAAIMAYDEFLAIPGAAEHVRLRTWAELAAAWAQLIVGSPARALEHTDLALALEGDWPSMTHFILSANRVHALALLGRTDAAVEEGLGVLEKARESDAPMAIPAIEMALAVAQLMGDDLESADAHARPLLEMPQTHTVALMREVLAQVALARGDSLEARVQAGELAVLAQRSGSGRHRAVVDNLVGCAAISDGDDEQGRERVHAALAVCAELGLERGAADALEELALLAAAAGDGTRTARLAAAAGGARARLGCAPLPRSARRVAAARALFVDRDGDGPWESAWAQGETLALADAIAYARRRRGSRARPASGWDSLTPAELEVAELAASGISNPQIAARLFMSRSTVKMHLSSVYLKLRIANRTELAGSIATHAGDLAARSGSAGALGPATS